MFLGNISSKILGVVTKKLRPVGFRSCCQSATFAPPYLQQHTIKVNVPVESHIFWSELFVRKKFTIIKSIILKLLLPLS